MLLVSLKFLEDLDRGGAEGLLACWLLLGFGEGLARRRGLTPRLVVRDGTVAVLPLVGGFVERAVLLVLDAGLVPLLGVLLLAVLVEGLGARLLDAEADLCGDCRLADGEGGFASEPGDVTGLVDRVGDARLRVLALLADLVEDKLKEEVGLSLDTDLRSRLLLRTTPPGEVLASDDLVGASRRGLTAGLGSVRVEFRLPWE